MNICDNFKFTIWIQLRASVLKCAYNCVIEDQWAITINYSEVKQKSSFVQ